MTLRNEILILAGINEPGESLTREDAELDLPTLVARVCAYRSQNPVSVALIAVELAQHVEEVKPKPPAWEPPVNPDDVVYWTAPSHMGETEVVARSDYLALKEQLRVVTGQRSSAVMGQDDLRAQLKKANAQAEAVRTKWERPTVYWLTKAGDLAGAKDGDTVMVGVVKVWEGAEQLMIEIERPGP